MLDRDAVPLELRGVAVVRDGATLLDGIDWTVGHGERWVVLGANGSGKTTLLRIASLYLHPSRGLGPGARRRARAGSTCAATASTSAWPAPPSARCCGPS